MAAASQPISAATRTKVASSAAGSTSSPIKPHLTKDIGSNLPASHQPCWRHGWDRLWSQPMRRPAPAFGASLWISAVACLHSSPGTDICLCRFPVCGLLADPRGRHGCRERARRVRYLHHHLSGAGGVHLPAPAQRARPAYRPGAAALRPVFRRATPCAAPTNDNVVTLARPRPRRRPRKSRPKAPSRPSAGRGSPKPGSAIAAGLDAIARDDKTFDAKHFVAGARAAYEMIVLAYAARRPPRAEESAVARSL